MLPPIHRQQTRRPVGTQVHHIATPEAGQPGQPHGKHQDQQNANEERGQGHAQQRQTHQQLRQPVTALQGRIDTKRNADHQGDQGRRSSQFQGCGEALRDQGRDLSALAQAQAKLALHGVADKARELNHKVLIQTQITPKLLPLFRRCVLPQQIGDWIAHVLKQHEGNECHGEHHQHCLSEATKYKCKHRVLDPVVRLVALRALGSRGLKA